jgi:hypothetical protein
VETQLDAALEAVMDEKGRGQSSGA